MTGCSWLYRIALGRYRYQKSGIHRLIGAQHQAMALTTQLREREIYTSVLTQSTLSMVPDAFKPGNVRSFLGLSLHNSSSTSLLWLLVMLIPGIQKPSNHQMSINKRCHQAVNRFVDPLFRHDTHLQPAVTEPPSTCEPI